MAQHKKILIVIRRLLLLIFIAALLVTAGIYYVVFAPNVNLGAHESKHFYITQKSDYETVKKQLADEGVISNIKTFDILAQRKNYHLRVLPGRYLIHNRMSNNSLINLLRSGAQEPTRLTFTNIRTLNELAGSIASQLEADSVTMLNYLLNDSVVKNSGLNTPDIKLLFIPNTYEVYWTTSPLRLITRMQREYNAFWNASRLELASQIGFTPEEVGILASIVQSETNRADEMPRIAGVYINRLRRNIPLQADPTVVYAIGDFSIRRVLNRHLETDSPYNTYLHAGLPPGPINLPEPKTIDAVLNYEKHDYLYFSASPEFNGYHVFARTYREHLRNAREYQQALNERRIFR